MDSSKMMAMIEKMKGMISEMEMACSSEGYDKPEAEMKEASMSEDSGDKKKMFVAMMKKKMG